MSKLQCPPRHTPEQHWLVQGSPSVGQALAPVQMPPAQLLSQHSTLVEQEDPAALQIDAVEHVWVAGSQKSEQHASAAVQAAPADLHSFGRVQRSWPSTS